MQSVAGVQKWQADHACDPANVSALVIETARRILDAIAPDPVAVVIQRQTDAVIEACGKRAGVAA
jgi:hypothetical protein